MDIERWGPENQSVSSVSVRKETGPVWVGGTANCAGSGKDASANNANNANVRDVRALRAGEQGGKEGRSEGGQTNTEPPH